MKTRFLAVLLSVCMLLQLLPVNAFAGTGESEIPTGTANVVYLDGVKGDDNNNGSNEEQAVKTFAKAKELLDVNGTIYVTGTVTVSGTETWSLENYGSAKVVRKTGSVIELIEGANLTLEHITIDGGVASENTSTTNGRAMIWSDYPSSLTLNEGCILQNDCVSQMGGAISGWNKLQLTMNEGAMIQNMRIKGAHYGGAVFLANQSTFTMNGGTITGCEANRGGGVALIGSKMTMNGGQISNNRAKSVEGANGGVYAGAIYLADYEPISGSDPNAISASEATFTMTGGTISGNSAESTGGAILGFPQMGSPDGQESKDVYISIQGGTITNNTSESGNGGGIAMYYNKSHLDISGGSIEDNRCAEYGGGVFIQYVTDAKFSGGNISSNSAKTGGGVAIYGSKLNPSKFAMSDGMISQNKAIDGSGGKAIDGSGGGVYLHDYCEFTMSEGSIVNNEVKGNGSGGGLYLCGNSTTKITGGNISKNKTESHLKYKNEESSWIPYNATYSNGIMVASQAVLKIGGTAEINPDDDITITVANSSDSTFYSYIQVISPEWNNGGQDVSVTSYSGSSPKYTVENVSLTAAGTQLVSYNTEDGSVTEAYVEAAENAERTRLFVPSAAMLEANPNLAIGQSKILNTNSMNNFMTYIPAPISIKPADITIYMGGDGYAGTVVDNDGNTVSGDAVKENGFPEPGFVVTLPQSLEEQLEADGNDITDLTLQYKNSDNTIASVWKFEKYGGGDHNVYRIKPTETTNTTPVRMTFTPLNGGDPIDSDDFDFTTALYEQLQMKIYGEGVEEGKVTVAYGENEHAITTGTATLTVRGTSDASDDEQYGQVTTDAANIAKGDSGVVAEADTIYTINGSKVQVGQDDEVALLFDDILEDNNITGVTNTELLTEKADQVLAAMDVNNLTGTGERQYEAKYLDLVDRSNGNAWLAADKSITVYWPLPEGTDKNTKFELLHYPGMHREMGISTIKENIDSCQVERVTIKDITDTHIVFDVQPYNNGSGGFSPYVLVWEDESSDGGDDGEDTPSTPVTPPDGDDTPDLNTEDHFSYIVGYPEDYRTGEPSDDEDLWPVKPQGNITRAEVATIFYRLLKDDVRAEHWTKSNDFTDVEADDWYNTPVSTLSAMGIITGYEDGSFKPNAPITRAEFAAMAVRFFEEDSAIYEKGTFNDIAGSEWFADAVQAAKDHSIIGGYPDGSFQPNKNISRAEACSIINRTLDRIPDEDHLLPVNDMRNWPDNLAGAWYYADMQEATNGHEYEWITDDGKTVENWTGELPEIDWDEVERELCEAHGVPYEG